ncbi:MAG: SIR2 family protein, partial [Azonexus sp.]
GYSLREWNSRTILQSLNRFFAKRLASASDDEIQSWAIDENFSELELKFWQKRGVYPYQINLDRFIEQLRERLTP